MKKVCSFAVQVLATNWNFWIINRSLKTLTEIIISRNNISRNNIAEKYSLEFKKEDSKICGRAANDRYGVYAEFEEAIDACKNDTTCQMIFDRQCDYEGPFELCHSAADIYDAEDGSCLYMKLSRK